MKKLLLHGLVEKGKDRYTAICLELNIVTEGETIKQTKANLQEAVNGFLKTVSKHGWEKELIPRSAPPKEWIKYFRAETREYRNSKIKSISTRDIQLQQVVSV